MEHKNELIEYILNNENRNAEALLSELRETSVSEKYATARERLLIVETAKSLNDMLPTFYADIKKLTVDLFEENVSVEDSLALLCEKVGASVKMKKQNSCAKAVDFILDRLTDNQLTVSLVADYTGITQSELVKLFKESKRITPGDYIGQVRAEKSCSFLMKNISVEKTASAVGFSSVETYIRTFKKHMGMTPGMWKKKNL